MEGPDFSPPAPASGYASRPYIGFPLATALLLFMIFFVSGMLSCCYHFDKTRSFRRSLPDRHNRADLEASSPSKSKTSCTDFQKFDRESLPVLMPGDQLPRFIALSCPRAPPRPTCPIVFSD